MTIEEEKERLESEIKVITNQLITSPTYLHNRLKGKINSLEISIERLKYRNNIDFDITNDKENYDYLLEKLDNHIHKINPDYVPTPKTCCNNEILKQTIDNVVCISCGKVSIENLLTEGTNDDSPLFDTNTYNVLKTYMGTKRFKGMNGAMRIHNWSHSWFGANKEKVMREIKKQIETLILKLNFENTNDLKEKNLNIQNLINTSTYLYSSYYIDEKIDSRGNIRNGLIVICIYLMTDMFDLNIGIFDLLRETKVSYKEWNTAREKIKDLKDTIVHFIPERFEDTYGKLKTYYGEQLPFSKLYLLEVFNKIFLQLKSKNIKVNYKTILISYAFTKLKGEGFKINKQVFCKLFSASPNTLTTFINKSKKNKINFFV